MRRKNVSLAAATLGLALAMAGCGNIKGTVAADQTKRTAETAENTALTSEKSNETETVISADGDGASVDGKTITIEKAGSYRLKGSLTEGEILIKAGDSASVKLILDGFTITNSSDAPIVCESAGKLTIELSDGTENKISDLRSASSDSDENESGEEKDAAVYSESDLLLTGTGSLSVEGGYEDAVHSKGELTVESGSYTLTASHNALNGKTALTVTGGSFTITAAEDALHSKGDLEVSDGSLTISAGDDALHSDKALTVKGGTISISQCSEGLEGMTVNVLGGEITVNSSDDAVNGSGETEDGTEAKISVNISGGSLKIVTDGDGIDSNGDLNISGGILSIDGPGDDGNAPIDYDGSAVITGGTVLASGMSGMFQSFDESSSTQPVIVYYLSDTQDAGTTISVTDESGKELYSENTETKRFNAVLFSSSELQSGKSYTIKVGSQEETVTISSTINTAGDSSMANRGPGAGGPQGGGGPQGEGGPQGGGGHQREGGQQDRGFGGPQGENQGQNFDKEKRGGGEQRFGGAEGEGSGTKREGADPKQNSQRPKSQGSGADRENRRSGEKNSGTSRKKRGEGNGKKKGGKGSGDGKRADFDDDEDDDDSDSSRQRADGSRGQDFDRAPSGGNGGPGPDRRAPGREQRGEGEERQHPGAPEPPVDSAKSGGRNEKGNEKQGGEKKRKKDKKSKRTKDVRKAGI